MNDEQILDLIINLFALYVPDSLDKRLVLERLNKNLWIPPAGKCLKCGKALICLECENFTVNTDVDVTLRIGDRIIHC